MARGSCIGGRLKPTPLGTRSRACAVKLPPLAFSSLWSNSDGEFALEARDYARHALDLRASAPKKSPRAKACGCADPAKVLWIAIQFRVYLGELPRWRAQYLLIQIVNCAAVAIPLKGVTRRLEDAIVPPGPAESWQLNDVLQTSSPLTFDVELLELCKLS